MHINDAKEWRTCADLMSTRFDSDVFLAAIDHIFGGQSSSSYLKASGTSIPCSLPGMTTPEAVGASGALPTSVPLMTAGHVSGMQSPSSYLSASGTSILCSLAGMTTPEAVGASGALPASAPLMTAGHVSGMQSPSSYFGQSFTPLPRSLLGMTPPQVFGSGGTLPASAPLMTASRAGTANVLSGFSQSDISLNNHSSTYVVNIEPSCTLCGDSYGRVQVEIDQNSDIKPDIVPYCNCTRQFFESKIESAAPRVSRPLRIVQGENKGNGVPRGRLCLLARPSK